MCILDVLDDSNLDGDIMSGIRHIRGGILGPSPRGAVKRSSIVALAVFVVVTGFFFERFPFYIAAATPARLAFGVGIVTAMIALYQSRTPMVISRNLFVYCYFIWFALLLVVHGDVGPFRQQATSIVTASFFLVLARYLDERHLPKLIVAAGLVMAAVSRGLFVLPSFGEAIGLRSAHLRMTQ